MSVLPPNLRTFLALIGLGLFFACGSDSSSVSGGADKIDEAYVQGAKLSITSIWVQGGGAAPASCNPNDQIDDPSARRDGNTVWCQGGWVETLSEDGAIGRHQGCFTSMGATVDESLAKRCINYADVHKALSPNDWLDVKRRILSAHPLQITDVSCQTPGVDCASDFGIPNLNITVDGNTNSFSWPDGARGLPDDLSTVIETLSALGFYL